MKASELRVGNYVKRRLYNPDMIVDFHMFDISDFYYCVEAGVREDEYFKDIIPIPLTEDVLVRFGFEREEDITRRVFYRKGKFYVWFGNGKDEKFVHFEVNGRGINVGLKSVDYVHDLQNLYFALTGEELTC